MGDTSRESGMRNGKWQVEGEQQSPDVAEQVGGPIQYPPGERDQVRCFCPLCLHLLLAYKRDRLVTVAGRSHHHLGGKRSVMFYGELLKVCLLGTLKRS